MINEITDNVLGMQLSGPACRAGCLNLYFSALSTSFIIHNIGCCKLVSIKTLDKSSAKAHNKINLVANLRTNWLNKFLAINNKQAAIKIES